jgi:hypothetical protein
LIGIKRMPVENVAGVMFCQFSFQCSHTYTRHRYRERVVREGTYAFIQYLLESSLP